MFKDGDTYLFNPEGLLFNEITASSLLKVDLKGMFNSAFSGVRMFISCDFSSGNVIGDSNGFGIDRQGWMIHASVYEALPSVRCIIQLNTPATIAVSNFLGPSRLESVNRFPRQPFLYLLWS